MGHDVSASRNLDSELPLGMSPPGLFSAFDRFHRRHRAHSAGVPIAFCTKNCCSPNRDTNQDDSFTWVPANPGIYKSPDYVLLASVIGGESVKIDDM